MSDILFAKVLYKTTPSLQSQSFMGFSLKYGHYLLVPIFMKIKYTFIQISLALITLAFTAGVGAQTINPMPKVSDDWRFSASINAWAPESWTTTTAEKLSKSTYSSISDNLNSAGLMRQGRRKLDLGYSAFPYAGTKGATFSAGVRAPVGTIRPWRSNFNDMHIRLWIDQSDYGIDNPAIL